MADPPGALVDLAVSLTNVGQLHGALGDWEAALGATQEAAQLRSSGALAGGGRAEGNPRRRLKRYVRGFQRQDIPSGERAIPSIFCGMKDGNEAFPTLSSAKRGITARSPWGMSSAGEGTHREGLSRGVPHLRRAFPMGNGPFRVFTECGRRGMRGEGEGMSHSPVVQDCNAGNAAFPHHHEI
jgi:hypothetical protein